MASWDNWMPELVLAAPTAPVPLIHQCLNRAARAFLRPTRAWQEWLEPTQANGAPLNEYTFELPQDSELLRIERATFNGRPLAVGNARDLASDPWQRAEAGVAILVSTDLQNFTVAASLGAGIVQAYVSLLPSLRANSVPDSVAGLYHEAIREGAKAELLATRGTDYYAPDAAAVALDFFQHAIDDATADVWRSHTSRLSRGRVAWL